MKCAVIDMGTNTVLLAIGDYVDGRVVDLLDVATITRLGEGLKETGRLAPEAMERTYKALSDYRAKAIEYGVEDLLCVGTAAMREAKNSTAFVSRVEEGLGIPVRIISAREEAYYTYISVRNDRFPGVDRFIIIDIGGGSTEIIDGDGAEMFDFVSLPVGSVKLTEMFINHDPPLEEELDRLTEYLRETIKVPFGGPVPRIIGTAGTVTNVAAIALGLEKYEKAGIHGASIGDREIGEVIGKLKGLTVAERRNVKGMEQGREDILLQGVILIKEIMAYFGARDLLVSANGVRYGLLSEWLRLRGPGKIR